MVGLPPFIELLGAVARQVEVKWCKIKTLSRLSMQAPNVLCFIHLDSTQVNIIFVIII